MKICAVCKGSGPGGEGKTGLREPTSKRELRKESSIAVGGDRPKALLSKTGITYPEFRSTKLEAALLLVLL